MLKNKPFAIFLSLALISLSLIPLSQAYSATDAVISLNPSQTYQTISGWEATTQAGQTECSTFDQYKNTLFYQAINDLGINRVRVEIKSGAENPVDYFTLKQTGQITPQE